MTNERDIIFRELLLSLEPDSPTIDEGFKRLRLKLIKFFSWRRCEDPESLADETIVRLVKYNSGQPEKTKAHAYSIVYAIARNVFLEYLRSKKKQGTLVDDFQGPFESFQSVDECRRECLEKLSIKQRDLLESYYLTDESREALAQAQGISINNLRLRIFRLKQRLKSCFEDCITKTR